MRAPCLLLLLAVLLAPALSAQETESPEGVTEITFATRNGADVDIYVVDPAAEATDGVPAGYRLLLQAPGSVSLPNGDYVIAVAVGRRYPLRLTLHAKGAGIKVFAAQGSSLAQPAAVVGIAGLGVAATLFQKAGTDQGGSSLPGGVAIPIAALCLGVAGITLWALRAPALRVVR